MNVFYEPLPKEIIVDDKKYKIKTDFRDWIMFIDMIKNETMTEEEKIENIELWFIDKVPLNKNKMISELINFLNLSSLNIPQKKHSPNNNESNNRVIFSYQYDAGYVISAFRETYRIDLLRIKYMHWWEFRMLFDGLPENCELKKRIYYRAIDISKIKDKAEKNRIKKIQQKISLPNSDMTDYDIANAFNL